jgi:hypothetical protein
MLALGTIERWVGSPTWDAVLAEFASQKWTACPKPGDLEQVAVRVTGLELAWLFRQVFDSDAVFDYAIERFSSERQASGSFRTTIVVTRVGSAVFTGTDADAGGSGMDLRVAFDDGRERVDRWDGRDRVVTFLYESPARAGAAEIDPHHVLLLDLDRTNNSRTLDSHATRAAGIWSARWILWLQDVLLTGVSLW